MNTPQKILSCLFFLLTPPIKMEQRDCSDTLARTIHKPGNHPKQERIQHTEQGGSLKSRAAGCSKEDLMHAARIYINSNSLGYVLHFFAVSAMNCDDINWM
jgi:hypothetical protein